MRSGRTGRTGESTKRSLFKRTRRAARDSSWVRIVLEGEREKGGGIGLEGVDVFWGFLERD